jgi:trehalose 6-phosphate synthase
MSMDYEGRMQQQHIYLTASRAPIMNVRDATGKIVAVPAPGGVGTLARDLPDVLLMNLGITATWVGIAGGAEDEEIQRQHGRGVRYSDHMKVAFIPQGAAELRERFQRFCNEVMWFVMHGHVEQPVSGQEEQTLIALVQNLRTGYREYSRYQAEALVALIGNDSMPTVLLQDYQQGGAVGILRALRPNARLGHYTHTTWPKVDVMIKILGRDVSVELVGSMLRADWLGFQTANDLSNFTQCVKVLASELTTMLGGVPKIGKDTISYGRWVVKLKAALVSVSPEAIREIVQRYRQTQSELFQELFHFRVAGRGDPMKGTLEVIEVFEGLLNAYPDMRGRALLEVFMPQTRSGIEVYDAYYIEAQAKIQRINRRYGEGTVILAKDTRREILLGTCPGVDAFVSTSLADGCNLTTLEASVAGDVNAVVMIITQTQGAASLLPGAIHIAPASTALKKAMHQAYKMGRKERQKRARANIAAIEGHTVLDWWREVIHSLLDAGQ